MALAQLLNCRSPRPVEGLGQDACGVCASCARIGRGVHADVLLIEPGETGAIKVDQIRDAIERSAYRPFEGRRRVVIVDDADAVLVEAQNALLKTLEEPPSASTFVLVTSRPDVLLPTVAHDASGCGSAAWRRRRSPTVLMREHGFAPTDAHAAASRRRRQRRRGAGWRDPRTSRTRATAAAGCSRRGLVHRSAPPARRARSG